MIRQLRGRSLLGSLLATGLGVSLLASVPVPAVASAQLPTDASFATEALRSTIAVLPDTQFYSRYASEDKGAQYQSRYGSTPFESQTKWIAGNQDKYGIQFTEHLGDLVDQAGKTQQWEIASDAMAILEEGAAPYQVVAGNHDVASTDPFLQHFSPERDAQQSTFGGRSDSGFGSFHTFTMNGETFLSIGLSWNASDDDIAWAEQVLEAHPTLPTIFVSHQLIDIDTDTNAAVETDFGLKLWDRLISKHNQIFLTYNGHHHGATQQVKTNDFGQPVVQQLLDYQMAYQGGNGYMSMVEFDFTNDKITQTGFSPWVLEKPSATLTEMDTAFLYGEWDTYTTDFDFEERFESFAPDFEPSGDLVPSYSKALREDIQSVYTDPSPQVLEQPVDTEDYPVVDGTLAHWRMADGGVAGSAVPGGGTIEDIAGENDLKRAELNSEGPVRDAELDDLTFSDDHSVYSADAGSVCFANTDRYYSEAYDFEVKRMSYFLTADDAPINSEQFDNGYTVETFIKIDDSWTSESNAWMTWLGRDGVRKNIEGYAGSDQEEPPVAGAISSLREVQWAFTDAGNPSYGHSNWSSDVDTGKWLHLAIVDDPENDVVTLYVDGAPVLRNVLGAHGLNGFDNLPWILGGGSYDGVRDSGFLGCIGETRIVDHALTSDQWLTARAADVIETPESSPSPSPSEPALEGGAQDGEAAGTQDPANETEPEAGSSDNAEEAVEGDSEEAVAATGAAGGDSVTSADETEASLARTGTTAVGLVGLALALIASGVVMTFVVRRRTQVQPDA